MVQQPADRTSYTLTQLRELLGLSRHAIGRLIEVGYVSPTRGPGKTFQFSFRDLVLLRSANDLREAGIATRQILRSLRDLRDALPPDLPISDLRVVAMGNRIAVRRAGAAAAPWELGSGQLVMDFSVAMSSGSVSFMESAATESTPAQPGGSDAVAQMFKAAEALEETDPTTAETSYRQVIEAAPDFAHAYINLGYLYCESDRFDEAVALYEAAVQACPDDPLILYNQGVALEAVHRSAEALDSYESALKLQPDLADAHQNAALLYAELGQQQMAIRHFSAYRRLQRSTC